MSVTSHHLLSSYLDTLCYGHDTTLTCINLTSTTENSAGPLLELVTSFTVLDPFIGGSQRAEGVGWRDPYGSVSHIDFATRVITQWNGVRSANFKVTDMGFLAAISAESLTKKFIANTELPFANSTATLDFSIGRAVLSNSWTCIQTSGGASCTFAPCNPSTQNCPLYTSYGPQASFTLLPAGANLPTLSLLNGMYLNSGNTLTYFGLKTCLDNLGNLRPESFATQSSCSMYIPKGVYTIPTLPSAISQVSIDSWGACAVTGGSLTCWSHVTYPSPQPWLALKSVTWVDVNDTGACVQYLDNDTTQKLSCWGTPYSATVPNPSPPPAYRTITNIVSLLPNLNQTLSKAQQYVSLRQPYFQCPNISDVVENNLCIPCPFGSALIPNAAGYSYCTSCSPLTPVRGVGDVACKTCSLGTEPTPDFSSCISCTSNSINSISGYSKCIECPPGTQATANRLACVACPLINAFNGSQTVRPQGAPQCSLCQLPNFYISINQPCGQCPQPLIPTLLKDSGLSYTCIPCPVGYQANDFGSCTQCSLSFARNTSQTVCTLCPQGYESSADFSSCTQCTGNTFRFSALACAECPKGTFANADFTSCGDVKVVSSPTLSTQQTAFLATGISIIVIIFASSSTLTHAQVLIGLFLGLAIAASGYFLS
jgi:hypothetical protein